MSPTDLIFITINLMVLPIWAAWFLAPSSAISRYFTNALWPWAVLAAAYAALIFNAMFIMEGVPGAGMESLPAVMKIFDSPWSTLAGWQHYICFDSFVARWIMVDVGRPSYRLVPILLLTCFFGPVGFLLYLLLRGKLREVE